MVITVITVVTVITVIIFNKSSLKRFCGKASRIDTKVGIMWVLLISIGQPPVGCTWYLGVCGVFCAGLTRLTITLRSM